jgi:defect-in-organelle-trafficking protein DotD
MKSCGFTKNMAVKKLSTIILLTLALGLAGCATTPPTINSDAVANDDAAQAKLAEAAVSVSQSLQQLSEMEKAVHPAVKIPPPPNPVSIGMAQLASITWNGPVEPLIRKIAAITHYRVRVIGRAPAIPALVSIAAQNTPLADILRDASFQAQQKANIVLYPNSRVIEIRYSS